MRTTGFGLSALLIAAGAILAWAVDHETDGIDLNKVGVILFIVGLGLALLTLILAVAGRRTTVESSSESVVGGRPVTQHKTETISDQDPNL